MQNGNAGIPCLRVPDARTAGAHYRDALGFELVAQLGGGSQPGFAIVRKHGAAILLQQVPGLAESSRRAGPPWDAVLLVDDVGAAHNELKLRGVDPLSNIDGKGIGWDSFDFPDGFGNIICIGRSADEFFDPGRGAASRNGSLARLRNHWQQRRASRAEQAHLREFQSFYDRLPNKENTFYMFFTSGLLHWVIQAESFVPREVNLVLLGSALTAEERRWLAANLDRPFHHIRLPVDDVTAWEYLFATNRKHFGWLDIDCFVLNGRLFNEMTELDPDTSMNCTWAWDSGYGFPVAGTHFLFVNVDTIRDVEEHGLSASPCTYDWTGGPRMFRPRKCFMKVPTEAQRTTLLKVLPADDNGLPRFLEGSYYNTLIVYQLLAKAIGYPIHQVRDLARRCGAPTDAASTDPAHWPEDMSAELFHLFGVSYYQTHRYEPGIRALYLAAEHIMLENAESRLPAQYAAAKKRVAAELAEAGLPPTKARERFHWHLTASRGLSESTADRILQPAPAPTG